MLLNVIKKEILLNLVSFRFVVCIILLFVLIVGSLQIMSVNYSRRIDDYQSSRDTHKEDIRNTSSLMQFIAFGSTYDPRPPLLGVFGVGLSQKMSSSFQIAGFNIVDFGFFRNPFYYQRFSRLEGVEMEGSKYANPVFTLFQPPDFVYVISIVLSLLAILFSFDCISGEKEDQTLKLMLSNSVPRDVVLFGKWIGGTLSLLVPFCVSFFIGLLLVSSQHPDLMKGDAPTRIMLIFGAGALYISVFFLVGMMFSTFTERPATSLIVSLFAWVFLVLVIPNIAPVLARQMKPAAPLAQIAANNEMLSRKAAKEHEALEDKSKEKTEAIKKNLANQVESYEMGLENRLANQTNLAIKISRISPSANFIYAATNLAGTGVGNGGIDIGGGKNSSFQSGGDFSYFKDQVIDFRDLLQTRGGTAGDHPIYSDDPERPFPPGTFIKINTDKLPEFENKTLAVDKSINNALIDLCILVVYAIILFMASFIGFLRYDVK